MISRRLVVNVGYVTPNSTYVLNNSLAPCPSDKVTRGCSSVIQLYAPIQCCGDYIDFNS